MFHVTLVNLNADASAAIEGNDSVKLGSLSARELIALLARFAEIDAAENMKADPEIRVQSRHGRFVVRTGQKKLFLQDARNLSEPAYVLTPPEIIAELDGSAAAKRTAPPFALASQPSTEETAPALPPRPEVAPRPWPFALIGLVLVLGGYFAYSQWAHRTGQDQPSLTPLTPSERAAEDSALTGVYTTGSEPGQHGIIILGDGRLKLFQANAQAAPGVVYGSYQFGRLESKLCLTTDQPGGLIKILNRESLEFCGELYKRVP